MRLMENNLLASEHAASKKQWYSTVPVECPPYICIVSCIVSPTFSRQKPEMPHLQTPLWLGLRPVTQGAWIRYTYVTPGFRTRPPGRRADPVTRAVPEASGSSGTAGTEPLASMSECQRD